MPAYNIKVTVKRKEMHLEVDYGLTGSGHPHLFLPSSTSSAPVLADHGPWQSAYRGA